MKVFMYVFNAWEVKVVLLEVNSLRELFGAYLRNKDYVFDKGNDLYFRLVGAENLELLNFPQFAEEHFENSPSKIFEMMDWNIFGAMEIEKEKGIVERIYSCFVKYGKELDKRVVGRKELNFCMQMNTLEEYKKLQLDPYWRKPEIKEDYKQRSEDSYLKENNFLFYDISDYYDM